MSPASRLNVPFGMRVVCLRPLYGGATLGRTGDGASVLVEGAIPGEVVLARETGRRAGVRLAAAEAVLEPSPHRRPAATPGAYAHVAYEQQLLLKAQVLRDGMARQGVAVGPVAVQPSPFAGHRMRARLHADAAGRVGFFAPRSHQLDRSPGALEALLPVTRALLEALPPLPPGPVELLENAAGTMRVLLLARPLSQPLPGWTALAHGSGAALLQGTAEAAVWDEPGSGVPGLRRSAGSFSQANRHLLAALAAAVVAPLPRAGRLWDLYAGGGLFAAAAAAARPGLAATAVERASADLADNAARFGFRAVSGGCAAFLRAAEGGCAAAVLDPPRGGCEEEVLALLALRAPLIVYVGCDVATAARDCRRLQDRGFHVVGCAALDMFPHAAQLETVVTLTRD